MLKLTTVLNLEFDTDLNGSFINSGEPVNSGDLHFNAAIKAFIAPSVSDIEGSDMHVIISAPHRLIAADIKYQTSFVFSRI